MSPVPPMTTIFMIVLPFDRDLSKLPVSLLGSNRPWGS